MRVLSWYLRALMESNIARRTVDLIPQLI